MTDATRSRIRPLCVPRLSSASRSIIRRAACSARSSQVTAWLQPAVRAADVAVTGPAYSGPQEAAAQQEQLQQHGCSLHNEIVDFAWRAAPSFDHVALLALSSQMLQDAWAAYHPPAHTGPVRSSVSSRGQIAGTALPATRVGFFITQVCHLAADVANCRRSISWQCRLSGSVHIQRPT